MHAAWWLDAPSQRAWQTRQLSILKAD